MNYANIKPVDIADGPGVRVSLFVSGCTHRCKGCFNPETWDFGYGEPYTQSVEDELIALLSREYIRGLTLLGGEPLEPPHQRALLPLLRRVRELAPRRDVWCYTGYVYEPDLRAGGRAFCEATQELLSLIDVLVDGPFIEEQRDLRLLFRGSANQRLIDLPATLRTGEVVLIKG